MQTDIADFEYLDLADDITRWPVIREGSEPTNGWPETFLYEGAKSGHGQRVDWQHAASVAQRGNMILAGGLNADNVAAAVAGVAPYGVDVSSGVETSAGEKDPRKIKAFIDAVNNQVQETTQ